MDDEAPLVSAYRSRDGQWLQFHCPYCGDRHQHAIPPLGAGEIVHRAAHCEPARKVENGRGYMIRERTKTTP
jgi:hypothetical protein